jgi:hypothetical protein
MPRCMQAVIDAGGGYTKYLLMTLYKKINCMYNSIRKLTYTSLLCMFLRRWYNIGHVGGHLWPSLSARQETAAHTVLDTVLNRH